MARSLAISGLVLAVALAVYFSQAGGDTEKRPAVDPASSAGLDTPKPASSSLGTPGRAAAGKSAWTPPEGDPVQRYRELRQGSAQERKDLIANFMALGHERNPYLLMEALSDPDPSVRILAVESASALPLGEATAVLQAAAGNDSPDAREMAWSLTAPYPVEAKATIFSGSIEKGNDATLEEAFQEMSISPERPLFEMMLVQAARNEALTPERRTRLLQELQGWLEPGGGDVPQFQTPGELLDWWQTQQENYDQYLLRVDVE